MSNSMDFPNSGNWTEAQPQLAFYFYCQKPFGQLHQSLSSGMLLDGSE